MADSTDTRKERRAAAREERDRAAEASRQRQRQRIWLLGGALALAAVVVVAIALATGGDDRPEVRSGETIAGQTEANERFAGIAQDGISVGDPRAPVTLVEFADLQCPFCRDYTQQVMPALVDYVRAGDLRMVFQNVAFIGTDSARGAQMAAAAGRQDKLWQFIDIFYANQGEENSGYVTDDFLRRVGGGVEGLDVDRAMDDRGLPEIQRQLDEAQTEWQSAGFTGTPSFLVGPTGGRLDALEIQSFDAGEFTGAIDRALAQQR
ncbi:MAG TPA: thioredoxin domain-containing protein [Conexibacter sp.]|nr:thioredoxin domain-containing protein [Conexibacter sp.]